MTTALEDLAVDWYLCERQLTSYEHYIVHYQDYSNSKFTNYMWQSMGEGGTSLKPKKLSFYANKKISTLC